MMVVMQNYKLFLWVAVLLMLLVGAGTRDAARANEAVPLRLLVFGDSLVAGYGLPQNEAFPHRLEEALKRRGHHVTAINGGISGDTSAGGVSRIDWALADNPDAVLVVLGGNDALRGLPPHAMADNLDAILMAIEARGLPVMVAGMRAPVNMGESYGKAFDAAFTEAIGKANLRGAEVVFYPFFLEGVALVSVLNQADGIHPNPAGVAVIVENILPHVVKLLSLAGGD